MTRRPLRFGMIGGGRGAFVGAIHRLVVQAGRRAQLVAGAFSSDPGLSRASGADLGLDPKRVYGDFREMACMEARRDAGERLDFVVIVTPTDRHAEMASLFLESGFNVICDKPVTATLAEARALRDVARRANKILAITYNYSGYDMVRQAKLLVGQGALGEVRKVIVEYQQGWLAQPWERSGQKQALWRMDASRSGGAGCLADLGVHAHHLVRFVTALEAEQLCASLTRTVEGREVPDDAVVLIRFAGGASGVLHCSQVSVGEENNLSLRVYGTSASLEWRQESPGELVLKYADRPREVRRRGNVYGVPDRASARLLPPGHPDGYLDAFSSVYQQLLQAVEAEVSGRSAWAVPSQLSIESGVADLQFVHAALCSDRAGGVWVAAQSAP